MPRRYQPLLLLAAALLAYHNSFGAPFVFDDVRLIVENEQIRALWPPHHAVAHTSRPLVQLSLAINFAISGLQPWSYHLLNLAIHFAAACTLLGVARRLFALSQSIRIRQQADGLALAVALLWLVHPLQTESVTYVIQRGEALAGLFCLLALYCFQRSTAGERARAWQAASIFCLFLGLAAKPVAAVMPLVIVAYDLILVGRKQAFRLRRRYYLALFAALAVLPLLLAGNRAEWATSAGFGQQTISPWQYAAAQPAAILRYLQLTFWPDGLCLDYGWGPPQSGSSVVVAFTILATVLGLVLWLCRRKPAALFTAFAFLLLLAPSSSFIPVADLIFEHRMYLPLAAVIGLAVAGVYHAAGTISDRLQHSQLIATAAVAAVAIAFTAGTVLRNEDYNSEVSLWTGAVAVSPSNARAHYNLGTVFVRQHRTSEAIPALSRAVELRPAYADAHYNLGNALLKENNVAKAILSYRRTLTLRPDDWQAHNNLGVAMLRIGENANAAAEFRQALALNPACESAKANLARLASGD